MAQVELNREIFRQYDIRGIAEGDLSDEIVERLGRAMGTYLKQNGCQKITLGRDCRLSSARLRNTLSCGLLDTGLHITDIGVCPTPLLYFSLHELESHGGIMITGSHNPAEYNGFKVALGKTTIYGDQIQQIGEIASSGDFIQGKGTLEKISLTRTYHQNLVKSFGVLPNSLRVVVDCGNGTASPIAPNLYRELGCEVIELYCTMDGHFPNHHPDPTVADNLQDLIQMVRQSSADLGIAFDGDADRIGVIDNRGNIIWGDELMILFSRSVLNVQPGATIIGEVKCSKTLYDDIERCGGRGIMWKAGHSLIKAKMKEEGAAVAGEMSGHIFFADRYFGYDDAIYAGARLLELISNCGQGISEMLADVPKTYKTPEIRMDCSEQRKFEIVSQVQEFFEKSYCTVTVDGVRVIFDDGWGLVRASNTQPALVLRFEADSQERLDEIQALVENKLEDFM